MHVWAEGRAHKVFLHNGLLVCRLWKATGPNAPRVAEEAALMSAAAQRMFASGIRPLGLVVDLASDVEVQAAEPALLSLFAAAGRHRLPVALVAGRRALRLPGVERWRTQGALTNARVLETMREAEAWLRGGVGEGLSVVR